MGLDAWITLAIVTLILGSLVFTRIAADIVFVGGLTLLLVSGVVTPAQAFAGFANEGVITIGALYVVVAGLRDTGGIHWITKRLLGAPRSLARAQLQLMLPVAGMSAFLNNTPVVAMLIPAVSDWSKKHGFAPSKLMIPLSYAAILGGTSTLIGTSTNLVVNGLLLEHGRDGLGMFDLAWIGLPTAALGLGFVLLLGRWLLPDRRSAISKLDDPREYSVEMIVEPEGPLVGQTIEGAGLRHLGSLYLIEIERGGTLIAAVAPDEPLQGSDRLVFVGVVDSVVELQRIPGLLPATDQVFKLDGARTRRVLIEAVISNSFPWLGRSVREARFRNHYDAAVIAVARGGERLKGKIGDIVFRSGDTLLLEARPSFVEQQRNSRDFFLVSRIEDSSPLRFERAAVATAILVAMVAVVSLGWLPLLHASLLAAGLMLITRCTRGPTARRNVDWTVLVTIAAAFGVGRALEASGLAQSAADGLMLLAGSSVTANLALLYLATALFSAVLTNNAAAVLMFPVALGMAAALGANLLPFAVTIAMAASASFATPIGYQTNLMVYGPGGYRFGDFLRIGVPLTLLIWALTVLVVPLVWQP